METRINKYLSQVGYCSRREADKLIDQGRITVNNNVIEQNFKKSVEEINSEKQEGENVKDIIKND